MTDNPQAFPYTHTKKVKTDNIFYQGGFRYVTCEHQGMTLREFYAGCALIGNLARCRSTEYEFHSIESLALLNYQMADAMLKERNKTNDK